MQCMDLPFLCAESALQAAHMQFLPPDSVLSLSVGSHLKVQGIAESINPGGTASQGVLWVWNCVPVLAQWHWQHLPAESCARARGSAWSLLSSLVVWEGLKRILFIIAVIPAAFHYRGVSVRVDNQTIWESCASVSVRHRHPWFVPACAAIIPVCCCCQRLGTAAAPPPCLQSCHQTPLARTSKIYFWILVFPPDFQNYSPCSFTIPVRVFQLPLVRLEVPVPHHHWSELS